MQILTKVVIAYRSHYDVFVFKGSSYLLLYKVPDMSTENFDPKVKRGVVMLSNMTLGV